MGMGKSWNVWMAVLLVAVCAMLTGCTTSALRLQGAGSWMQPKDVTIGDPGIEYTSPDGTKLVIRNYTSCANVAAVQAQAALTQGLVESAVGAALKAVAPVSPVSSNSAPRAPAVGVIANDGSGLMAVETTTILPAAGEH